MLKTSNIVIHFLSCLLKKKKKKPFYSLDLLKGRRLLPYPQGLLKMCFPAMLSHVIFCTIAQSQYIGTLWKEISYAVSGKILPWVSLGKKGAETGPVNLRRGILKFDATSYLEKKSPDDSEDMKKYI